MKKFILPIKFFHFFCYHFSWNGELMENKKQIFKNINEKMKKIIRQYMICQVKIQTLEKIKNKDDLSNNNNWKIYKNYISYIDTIFDCLSPECANLLKSIYFKHIGMDDLGYSITSAYRRLTIAIKTFMEFFDNSLCQSI